MRHLATGLRSPFRVCISDFGYFSRVDIRKADIRAFDQKRFTNRAANALRCTGHNTRPTRDSCHLAHPYFSFDTYKTREADVPPRAFREEIRRQAWCNRPCCPE
jgi:hypothetical protein